MVLHKFKFKKKNTELIVCLVPADLKASLQISFIMYTNRNLITTSLD